MYKIMIIVQFKTKLINYILYKTIYFQEDDKQYPTK